MQPADNEISCLGLILRAQPYGDKDIIYSILTENTGKISAIAKSAKGGKKFNSGIPEMLDLGLLALRKGRGPLFYVQSFKPQQAFKQIRNNLNTFVCACCWIEALDHLTSEAHGESHELFEIAISTLQLLNQAIETRGACKILCEGFNNALQITGFGSEHSKLPVGFKKMQALVARIIDISGRELKSWSSVVDLVSKLEIKDKSSLNNL